jgi:hypothetical protein
MMLMDREELSKAVDAAQAHIALWKDAPAEYQWTLDAMKESLCK